MKSDPHSAAERDRLLDKLKERYEPGAMRPQLYVSAEPLEHGIDILRMQWMFYAGMGEVDFHPASPAEQRAATELLDQGWLVSTAPFSHYGLGQFQRVQLIEDLNWGLIEGGKAVIFDLSAAGKDQVIKADEAYTPALDELRKRLEYGKAYAADPVVLNDGTPVVPIHFNKTHATLRSRQQAFEKHMV